MVSQAFTDWQDERSRRLDRLLDAHRAVAGAGPGRRYVTEELNHALIVRLAGEFQGFCRDLHDEMSEAVVDGIPGLDPGRASLLRASLIRGRKLDSGNANWGNLGGDFGVFGLSLRAELQATYGIDTYKRWVTAVDGLNAARNAIAHQNSDQLREVVAASGPLHLAQFRRWRSALGRVASGMDVVAERYLTMLNGTPPW